MTNYDKKLEDILSKLDSYPFTQIDNSIFEEMTLRAAEIHNETILSKIKPPFPFDLPKKNISFSIENDGLYFAIKIPNLDKVLSKEYIDQSYSDIKADYNNFSNIEFNSSIILSNYSREEIFAKINEYNNNYEMFYKDITKYCQDIFEKKLNNIKLKISNLNKEEYYNIVFFIAVNLMIDAVAIRPLSAPQSFQDKLMIQIKNLIYILEEYDGVLEGKTSKGNYVSLKSLKEQFNSFYKDEQKFTTIPRELGASEILSHCKDNSIPIFYDDRYVIYAVEICAKLNTNNESVLKSRMAIVIKYSKLFEYGYNVDEDIVVLGLKKGMDFSKLVEIAANNLQLVKESDIANICEYYGVSIDETIKCIKNEGKFVCSQALSYILNTDFTIKQDNTIKLIASAKYLAENLKDLDNSVLIQAYYYYTRIMSDVDSLFIKFADKSNLKPEYFTEISKETENEIISRIGKEKLDNIFELIEEKVDHDNYEQSIADIVASQLIQKKSIDEEIASVERQKATISKTDPIYNQLNMRLEKLKFFKEHYDSEQVIPCDSKAFSDYYGFEFDNLIVFDCFIDNEEDIKTKAKKEYGKRIYILTPEDYLKVKDLKNRTEIKNYIDIYLKPCAGYVNNGENLDIRLSNKIEEIRMSVLKRDSLLRLVDADNPVTEEELKYTQEELDYYVAKYLPSDFDTLDKMASKTKDKKIKNAINKKIGVEKVERETKEGEHQDDLNNALSKKAEKDVQDMLKYLEEANKERIENDLEPLSFDKDSFIEVYLAIDEYKKKHNIKTKTIRDPQVAYETKERTYYNGEYHCDLCGAGKMVPVLLESHHFIPISEGGPDNIYNTACLCTECHTAIHNGLVTDQENYKLIEKIRYHIETKEPELLVKFEKTLGFSENYYTNLFDELQARHEALMAEGETKSAEELEKIISEDDKVKKEQARIKNLANIIQDYYRYSDDYQKIEEKTK